MHLFKLQRAIKRKLAWRSEFDRQVKSPIWCVLTDVLRTIDEDMIWWTGDNLEKRFDEISMRWREIEGPRWKYTPERAVFGAHQDFANWFRREAWNEEKGDKVLRDMAESLWYRAEAASDFDTEKAKNLISEDWMKLLK